MGVPVGRNLPLKEMAMRTAVISLAVAVAGCNAPPPPTTSNSPISEIAGRVAGLAQRCVLMEQGVGLRVANRNTFTYRSGETIWVNRVQGSCGGFGQWDTIVTEPIGTQHCRGDLVRSFDPVSRIPGPSCQLGDFVPYTRP